MAVFRLCERIDRKHRKAQLDLAFLIQCRDHGVVPRFLNFKLANQHLRQSQTYEACRGRLLAQEIHHKRNNIKRLGTKLESTLDNLRTSVSFLDFQHLTSFISLNNVKSLQRSEVVQNQKLERLKQEYLSNGIDPDKVIFNHSNYELSDIEKKVLSRGLRFGIRPDKLNYCQVPTPFENLAFKLKREPLSDAVNFDFNYIKTRLKAMAYSSYYSYSPESLPLNISKVELLALKNLSRNKEIVVLHPDKGNRVVILNRTDYVSKIESLLEDATKSRPLDTDILDLCINCEGKLIRYLRDTLLKNDIISE